MKRTPRGFTLIELLVSVALFSVVMLISVGSLVAMAEAARKAESIKSVLNNLNFAFDSMSRTIRTGYLYHCTDGTGDTYSAMGAPATTLLLETPRLQASASSLSNSSSGNSTPSTT